MNTPAQASLDGPPAAAAASHPADGHAYLGGSHRFQRSEPLGKGAVAIVEQQFFDLVAHGPNGNV